MPRRVAQVNQTTVAAAADHVFVPVPVEVRHRRRQSRTEPVEASAVNLALQKERPASSPEEQPHAPVGIGGNHIEQAVAIGVPDRQRPTGHHRLAQEVGLRGNTVRHLTAAAGEARDRTAGGLQHQQIGTTGLGQERRIHRAGSHRQTTQIGKTSARLRTIKPHHPIIGSHRQVGTTITTPIAQRRIHRPRGPVAQGRPRRLLVKRRKRRSAIDQHAHRTTCATDNQVEVPVAVHIAQRRRTRPPRHDKGAGISRVGVGEEPLTVRKDRIVRREKLQINDDHLRIRPRHAARLI